LSFTPRAPILAASYEVIGAREMQSGREVAPGDLADKRLLAFAGLGSPRGFADTLRAAGVRTVNVSLDALDPKIYRQVTGGDVFTPVGMNQNGQCEDGGPLGPFFGGNLNGVCNKITDRNIHDFADLDETDVIGGNKFSSASFEYRFPISETVGLQGVAFIDMGNAFDERQYNLVDVTQWRYGTGAGVQWFSPFGPLAVVLGFPLDRLSVEKSPVFEFSIGGSAF